MEPLVEEGKSFPAFVFGACALIASILILLGGCNQTAHAAVVIDMERIKIIESSGNPLAHNKKEDGRGLYQISRVVLQEWNSFHPNNRFVNTDLWDAAINYQIANWYMNVRIPKMLQAYGIADNVQNRLIAYNAGIKNAIFGRVPPVTKQYLAKYRGAK